MKKSLLAQVSLVAGAGLAGLGFASMFISPVMAADLPAKTVVKAEPAYSWTGCYAGAHFGSLHEQQDWGLPGSDDESGLLLGGQLGCNYQVSTWVFGVQGDAAWSDLTGSHTDQVSGLTDEWKTDTLASVTGRFGYAWGHLLAYGKGGVAWTHNAYDISGGTTFPTASETRTGWTAGGGLEYAYTNNLSMFVEYNFYQFGTQTVGFSPSGSLDIRDRSSVVKVGLNWKPW
jgi:outer membrane immunogenic protein